MCVVVIMVVMVIVVVVIMIMIVVMMIVGVQEMRIVFERPGQIDSVIRTLLFELLRLF